MSRLDELRNIAELVGITTRHVDALGVWHEPDEETLARLIAAFGLPAEPQQAGDALAAQEREISFGLAPLVVVPQEASLPSLRLRLPAGANDVEWHLGREDGEESAGRSDGNELRLPVGLPPGYHRLSLSGAGASAEVTLAIAPECCHLGAALDVGAHSWGLTVQLYGLRSDHGWGIGDFTDLKPLCRRSGSIGAATVGLNPLHALFAAEPRHYSPYSPSSRDWLNWLYIDVTSVSGFADDPAARALAPEAAIAAARNAELVDYAAVAAVKRPVLEALYRRLRARGDEAEFRSFLFEHGEALAEFCVFEALHEHFLAHGGPFSWQEWPAPMRDPHSVEVAEFARAHADRVEFFQFLQWQADRQLGAAAAAGRAAGMPIGLYRDLAVGVNPAGAEAWANQQIVVPGASIGAPPDPLSRAGQEWGLAPINPVALRRHGFAPFIAALRANMRHAGILRIDHVMSLQRLYWVPSGMPPTAGAYVDYPLRDLLRLVALESHRQRCAVIGEDLGTVPEGFREVMQRANVLSYRVVMFERGWDGGFIRPGDYPPLAAASAATHDLATLKGFWLGRDIGWRQRLAIYPDASAEASEIADRDGARRKLLDALIEEGLLAPERSMVYLPPDNEPVYDDELGAAIFGYLARSRSRLALVQVEDIAGEVEQANLPGTTDAHPNWRRRVSLSLDDFLAGPALARIAALVNEARGNATPG